MAVIVDLYKSLTKVSLTLKGDMYVLAKTAEHERYKAVVLSQLSCRVNFYVINIYLPRVNKSE